LRPPNRYPRRRGDESPCARRLPRVRVAGGPSHRRRIARAAGRRLSMFRARARATNRSIVVVPRANGVETDPGGGFSVRLEGYAVTWTPANRTRCSCWATRTSARRVWCTGSATRRTTTRTYRLSVSNQPAARDDRYTTVFRAQRDTRTIVPDVSRDGNVRSFYDRGNESHGPSTRHPKTQRWNTMSSSRGQTVSDVSRETPPFDLRAYKKMLSHARPIRVLSELSAFGRSNTERCRVHVRRPVYLPVSNTTLTDFTPRTTGNSLDAWHLLVLNHANKNRNGRAWKTDLETRVEIPPAKRRRAITRHGVTRSGRRRRVGRTRLTLPVVSPDRIRPFVPKRRRYISPVPDPFQRRERVYRPVRVTNARANDVSKTLWNGSRGRARLRPLSAFPSKTHYVNVRLCPARGTNKPSFRLKPKFDDRRWCSHDELSYVFVFYLPFWRFLLARVIRISAKRTI